MADHTFDTWLAEKLNSLSLDEEVYSDYLKSVLEEEESEEYLRESLCDILSGVLENGASETADEILKVWGKGKSTESKAVNGTQTNINDNLKALMEQQTQQQQLKFANKKSKTVDHELKNKLLAEYGEISDGEEEYESEDDDKAPSDFVNVNAKLVTEKIQHEREKSKKEFEEKKQRDKVNLAKDKSKKEDRKDKEKSRTQKGERKAR